jgi:hypothetical protein
MPMTQKRQYQTQSKSDLVDELLARDESDYECKAALEQLLEVLQDDGYRVMKRVELAQQVVETILETYFYTEGEEDE